LGVLLLTYWSALAMDASVLIGDFMFIGASALGALYVLQLRSWRVGAIQAAAIVSVYSALIVVPYCLWSGAGKLAQIAATEILWQVLWQGLLIGCISLIALNHAITRLGAERSSALIAAVPVLSAVLALMFLGEVPSLAEAIACFAISAGVLLGASRGYAGSPAATSAAMKRSAWGLSRPG
jgi:drug/metabolite transporter (DMT)-like permease